MVRGVVPYGRASLFFSHQEKATTGVSCFRLGSLGTLGTQQATMLTLRQGTSETNVVYIFLWDCEEEERKQLRVNNLSKLRFLSFIYLGGNEF